MSSVDEIIERRAALLAHLDLWIGTPYRHQMSACHQGTDCLGLVRGAWRFCEGAEPQPIPPYTPDWVEEKGAEPLLHAAATHLIARDAAALQPGDVLLFRVARMGPAKHCGIYVGGERFVHAYAGRHVVESWLSQFWRTRLVGVFAFPSLLLENAA